MSREANPRLQPALLGFLTLGPLHAYALHAELKRELGGVWRLGLSQLYAFLKALEHEGLVETRAEQGPRPRERIVYSITEAGKTAFLFWAMESSEHARHFRLDFLVRLYFVRRLSPHNLPALAASQSTVLKARLESLEKELAKPVDAFEHLVLDFRRSEILAILNWLDRCLGAA